MSTNIPSTTDTKPTPATYAPQPQSSGNLYSFSVHQPYTNWPLHSSHTTPYAPSWYSHPAPQYTPHRTYREQASQTGEDASENALNGKGKEREAPKSAKQWETAITTFLERAGLQQSLAGFQEDMLLMNEDWEREQIPSALRSLIKDIAECTTEENLALPKKSLEERKLEHVPSQTGVEVQSPSSTVKSVSRLLRESRRRNNVSNRAEFLLSAAEKRRRLNELGESSSSSSSHSKGPEQGQGENGRTDIDSNIASCARADAKFQDRDTQMKYDIARNEDGPLKRTMKGKQAEGDASVRHTQLSMSAALDGARGPNAKDHPRLAARMETMEEHLGVRFVPSRPRSLLDRLKFLEDYIIRLEKDYPPWAALHFNQPNRGWPPPPRSTPIIVPPHLASPDSSSYPSTPSEVVGAGQGRNAVPIGAVATASQGPSSSKSGGGSKAKSGQSSLQRAVMERLEIKRAMSDLTGGGLSSFDSATQGP